MNCSTNYAEARQESKTRIIEALRSVHDPEIPVNIYDLGLVYDITAKHNGQVEIRMTLTSPACPVAGSLPPAVQRAVEALDGVKACLVKVVWDPPWGPHLMSEAARLQLNIDLDAYPLPKR